MSVAINQHSGKDFGQEPHISYSQLTNFLICPQRYRYQYVLEAEWERKSAALPFGSAIHRAVENYYRALQESGEVLSAETLFDIFEKVLEQEVLNSEVEIVFKDGENLDTLKQQGAELLKVFTSEIKPQKIVGVEVPFSVKVPDLLNRGFLPVRLVGFFDLVEADSDGVYVVVELKTSAMRFSEVKLKHDLQSTVYSYAMAQMGLATSDNGSTLVRYDVLLKQKQVSFERYYVSRTLEEHQRLVQLLNQVVKAVDLGVFYRLNGWQCGECQFLRRCMSDF